MRVLGIETSCDETGIAIYDSQAGILADALYSQVELHAEYGGVVPELASRDHVRKVIPLIKEVMARAITSFIRGMTLRTWSRDASSGTTPPYSACSSTWLYSASASIPAWLS